MKGAEPEQNARLAHALVSNKSCQIQEEKRAVYHVGPCAGEDREALCTQTKQHEGLTTRDSQVVDGVPWSAHGRLRIVPWRPSWEAFMEAILRSPQAGHMDKCQTWRTGRAFLVNTGTERGLCCAPVSLNLT